jgi:hypothetical protein
MYDKNGAMKFNISLMNPPYGSTHLKVLKKMTEIVIDKHNGQIVTLQPIRWLQDPLWKHIRHSDAEKMKPTLNGKIFSVDIISAKNAKKIFKREITMNLGILNIKKNGLVDYDSLSDTFSFIYRIINNKKHILDVADKQKRDGIRVVIHAIGNSKKRDSYRPEYPTLLTQDGLVDGKDWTLAKMKNQYTKPVGSLIPLSIKFLTIKEAQNFIDSTKTLFWRFLYKVLVMDVHIHNQYFPWMGDYTTPWTNERFYEYFHITSEEQKLIEDSMKEYNYNDLF